MVRKVGALVYGLLLDFVVADTTPANRVHHRRTRYGVGRNLVCYSKDIANHLGSKRLLDGASRVYLTVFNCVENIGVARRQIQIVQDHHHGGALALV